MNIYESLLDLLPKYQKSYALFLSSIHAQGRYYNCSMYILHFHICIYVYIYAQKYMYMCYINMLTI